MAALDRKAAYHHGDLRRAALSCVQEHILAEGAGSVTIRGNATELGVTHTAIGHVFGSRKGLLTALATEGFVELARRLREQESEGLLQLGLAYVRFGLDWPAHFAVMFDADLVDETDEFRESSGRAWELLRAGIGGLDSADSAGDPASATIAAWSLMHGLVTLHTSGALRRADVARHDVRAEDILQIAERAGAMLFRDQP